MNKRAARRSSTKRWLVRFPRTLPLGIFFFVTAITIISLFAIERSEAQRANVQLSSRATAIASALERRANASSAYMRAGAALLASVGEVQPDQFGRFVSELRLDADYRGAGGIGWARAVRPGEIDEFNRFLAQVSPIPAELHPLPTGEQPISVPVTFLRPDTERNRRALGFDMFSERVRREAMQEAERTARPTASGKVVLAQEAGGEEPGFLIYMPVFEPAAGGRQLRGYIYSPFNADDFMTSALELEDAGQYGVRLFYASEEEQNLLASTFAASAGERDTSRQQVTIANTPFVLQVSRSEDGVLSGLSMATLIFGLLVASLLMLLVRMLTQQAVEDEASLVWFEEQASIRNSLTRELNHRVKNTLANVLSIIALTRRRSDNVGEFADGLDGRIRALSATHDLLTKSDWGTTPVEAVIKAELLPYAQDSEHVIVMQGPEVELAPNEALSLGLAMHELATNAAKYGALSRQGGHVSVRWELAEPELLRVEWKESGGPAVPSTRARGFGTDLIERVVASELRNPVRLEFPAEGVRCILLIPVRKPTEFAIRASKAAAQERLKTSDLEG